MMGGCDVSTDDSDQGESESRSFWLDKLAVKACLIIQTATQSENYQLQSKVEDCIKGCLEAINDLSRLVIEKQ
jgi:hypothetical protein